MNRLSEPASARRSVIAALGRSIATCAILFIALDSAHAIEIQVGPREVIYTNKQLKSKSLTWPDGSLGVVHNGQGGYEFYAPNGSKPIKTTGTLNDPARFKSSVTISNLPKKAFSSVSGGPVYYDAASGARLMIYEAEKRGKKAKDHRSVLGLAISTDASGLNFRDLGTIIEPNRPTGGAGIGGGSFAVVDDYLHVYYRDSFPNGSTSEVAVARAPLSDLIAGALGGAGASFTKYYDGSWSQPGRGGLSSPLQIGNPSSSWLGVSHNDYLDQLVMVTSQWEPGGGDLYLSTSSDGINWSARQPVALEAGEQMHPSIIGTGIDPTHSGQSMYLYYTDSIKGPSNRWKDGQLVRREITFNPIATGGSSETPAPTPVPPTQPMPTSGTWSPIAGFRADYQMGTPADGWTYAWNPTGQLGNSNNYVPLKWSDVAMAYNTTGVATQLPGIGQDHNDDYLVLLYAGGHPGKPGYMPIVGYTIGPDDGAGNYRLADSSITKIDSLVSQNEDGLGLKVYLNDDLLGTQFVSTDGLTTSFNRDLGQLNVGDTVWVMIDPLTSHWFDHFNQFDFKLQKFIADTTGEDPTEDPDVKVPEPGTAALFLIVLAGWTWTRRRRA
jgi:hypothetical protein